MEKRQATNGHDAVLPSDHFYTTDITKPVKLRFSESEASKIPPMTVPSLLAAAAAHAPDRPALAFKKNKTDLGYHFITFKQYSELTRTVAKAFLKLGLERFHTVCIIGFNSPEWFVADLAAIHAGGVACGIYTTNSAEATFYCLKHSGVNIAVAEDENQVKKILTFKDKLPELKAIIQYTGKPQQGILSWEEVVEIGKNEKDDALEEVLNTIAVNQCCSLVYTSGTTGNPKAVMLSHDNLVWNVRALSPLLNIENSERIISYLPLSHVAAQSVDIYCSIQYRVTIYFADRDALKGGLLKTLQEVKPTRFLGVPRVWEKIAEKMKSIGASVGPVKKMMVDWAKNQGLNRNMDLMKGINNPSLGYILAKALVFSKVKANLGLNECRTFWTAAAPLASDIKKYFASLDILIMEVFGMSESSGVHTLNAEKTFKIESVGKSIPGVRTKLGEDGEVCMYGRHVFMGYLNDEEKTRESIDQDGWLHSGDLGSMDEDGFLRITGRLKELLITSGGENIAPVPIEQNIKSELPFLSQAVLICDKKKFLSVLIVFACDVNGDTGEPLDELSSLAKDWLKKIGCPFDKMSEIMASGPDKKILDAIQRGIDAANEKSISNAQKIQKFALLPGDFSIATGELGPTLKLKRGFINEKYKDIIERFYE